MAQPLVSVICLCYNQASFVVEALESVVNQTYSNVELIIVDDASTDASQQVIRQWLNNQPREYKHLLLNENVGNCRAFNRGYALSSGQYVIDLAADDLLHPERIAKGVAKLEQLDKSWGVEFTDAWFIDEEGEVTGSHYPRSTNGELLVKVPAGYVYTELLKRYFICAPTQLYRREVLEDLGGYDETLAYEDFDFWVRAGKKYKFAFTPELLVSKRKVEGSWSSKQYDGKSRQLQSTLKVCQKAAELNTSKAEDKVLGSRIKYEMRQACLSKQSAIAYNFWQLKRRVNPEFIDFIYLLFVYKGSFIK